jgi:hypothetical protein
MKMNTTRIAIAAAFVLCMFAANSAHAQASAAVLSNTPQPLTMQDHVQHATQHAMAQESSLLNNFTYTYAKGEVPLAEVGSLPYEVPLGDIARSYRQEHKNAPKAVVKFEK